MGLNAGKYKVNATIPEFLEKKRKKNSGLLIDQK
jgi:hypothetical protein